ncbi:MAG: hypothetical protein IKH11_07060, partial [Bacteroidales bacterium]|nr:hypothetical protein [Bacteroidales bacterium]
WTEETQYGHKGYKVKGPSGKSIFLPFPGSSYDGSTHNVNTDAYYWTSEIYTTNSKAYAFYVKTGTASKTSYAQRRTGANIRAVEYKGSTPTPPPSGDHNYINLGLPSGTLWADCNVGASKPEAYGSFYAWGETSTKSSYSWSNYQYASGSSSTAQNLGTHIAGTKYDAATKNWGGDWVMPTIDQANELLKKCTVSLATVNNVPGLRFKGPNGNTIFFPMTGYKYDSKYSAEGTQCYIWTDTKDNVSNVAYKSLALYLERSSSSAKANTQAAPRRSGVIVRAVKKEGGTEPYTDDPPAKTASLVDLGLSVKWCDQNIGSDWESEYGDYYAWGETSQKSTYTWANYKHASGSSSTVKNIGDDISATDYDVAYQWSDGAITDGSVCLPTKEQWEELRTKCTWKEETEYGHKGFRVTGPSGKSIFLPFSGSSYDGGLHDVGTAAYYWTSETYSSNTNARANAFYIKTGTAPKTSYAQKRTGVNIRAVEYEFELPGSYWEETYKPELVDLGLSVKWCDVNLDCMANSEDGEIFSYFAWGETSPKDNYTWANYRFASGSASTVQNIGSNIQATNYDPAYVNEYESSGSAVGAPRRHAPDNGMAKTAYDPATDNDVDICMPTKAQWEELRTKCTWQETTERKHKGFKVTGPNGNSIFIPFAGAYYDGSAHNVDNNAYYWTSEVYSSDASKANALYIKTGTAPKMSYAQRRTGLAVRAVEYKTSTPTPPPSDDHDYVNLGLPSGTLWATCNVGASSPEGYGNYYAWGETSTKSTYSWSNYQYASGSSSTCQNLGTHIAGTSYDAATKNWGSNWVMPTIDQANELLKK